MNETWKCDDFHRFLEASFLGWWPIRSLTWPGSWKITFLLGRPIFRGYVSFREGISTKKSRTRGFEVFLGSWPILRGGPRADREKNGVMVGPNKWPKLNG